MADFFNGGHSYGSSTGLDWSDGALTTGRATVADRMGRVGLGVSFAPSVSREAVGVNGGIQLSGLMAVVGVLGALWAVDRYGFNVPFFKATGA